MDFKTKWLISGGFLLNYNSSECGGHVLEQNDNFMESDWSKKSTWPSIFTTILILSAENRVDCSALWIDEIPNELAEVPKLFFFDFNKYEQELLLYSVPTNTNFHFHEKVNFRGNKVICPTLRKIFQQKDTPPYELSLIHISEPTRPY